MLSLNPALACRLQADGRPIVITGAGGWLGRATLEALHTALGEAFAVRVLPFGSGAREQRLRSGSVVNVRPLSDLDSTRAAGAIIFHYAYLTKERIADLGAERFSQANEHISATVERFVRRCGSSAIFVPSSGAVYDLPLNPYAEAKLLDEARFTMLATAGIARVSICRVFNLGGPYLNKIDAYALGSILRDIGQGGPITLRAERKVFRSYVHVGTVIELAVATLLSGPPLTGPFDTAGDEVVELSDLALRAAALLGHSEIPIDRPSLRHDAVDDRYVGDPTMMNAMLRNYGIDSPGLDRQILDTAAYLQV